LNYTGANERSPRDQPLPVVFQKHPVLREAEYWKNSGAHKEGINLEDITLQVGFFHFTAYVFVVKQGWVLGPLNA